MDIVEIVTTIAHKISNCKHFFVSFRMLVDRKERSAKRFYIHFLRYSLFFSFSFFFIIFILSFIPFVPFTFNKTAPMSILLHGYLRFALKQKPLHRYVAMPFDVSYAKRYALQMASKNEIDERVKIKYTKPKRYSNSSRKKYNISSQPASNNIEIERSSCKRKEIKHHFQFT